jgi:transposase
MFAAHRQDYPSETALAEAVAQKLGVGQETSRRWLVQADINAACRPSTTSNEAAEIRRLTAGVKMLREDNETLKAAMDSSPVSSTPATADHGVHQRHDSQGPCGRVDLPSAHRARLQGRRADLQGLEAEPTDRSRPES